MKNFIHLYQDFMYRGFAKYPHISKKFALYKNNALELAKQIGANEIILYAILVYDDTGTFLAADLMTLRMDYPVYFEFCNKLSKRCRPFFVRGSQEA